MCNLGRRYYEEQFYEIILNLNQWFRGKSRFNVVLIWISDSTFVQLSVIICAFLLEGIQRNDSVNYFEFGSVVQMSFKRLHIWSSGHTPVLWSSTSYAILEESIIGNIHVKLYNIWTSGPGGNVV